MGLSASERAKQQEETQFLERGVSLWQDAWHRLLRNRMAVAGLIFVGLLVFCALTADFLPPYSYRQADYENTRIGPRWPDHIFGTDKLGRDVFTRVWWGTRVSLTVAVVGSLTSLVIGITYGLISGYSSVSVDNVMMRFVDFLYGFPILIFVILMQVYFKAVSRRGSSGVAAILINIDKAMGGLFFVFIALGLLNWIGMARIARGQTLSYKQKEFIEAARAVGAGNFRIIFRHLLPNILGPCIVAETLAIPGYISWEAFLSFIGLGVNPPVPSWGLMISETYQALRVAPHECLVPGAFLALTTLAFNFLGDGLRDAFDPRLRGT